MVSMPILRTIMIITSIFSVRPPDYSRQFYSLSLSLLRIALPGRLRYSQINFSSNHDPDVCQSSNSIFSRSNYLSYTVETLTRNTPINYILSIILLSFHSQLHLPHLQRTLIFLFFQQLDKKNLQRSYDYSVSPYVTNLWFPCHMLLRDLSKGIFDRTDNTKVDVSVALLSPHCCMLTQNVSW